MTTVTIIALALVCIVQAVLRFYEARDWLYERRNYAKERNRQSAIFERKFKEQIETVNKSIKTLDAKITAMDMNRHDVIHAIGTLNEQYKCLQRDALTYHRVTKDLIIDVEEAINKITEPDTPSITPTPANSIDITDMDDTDTDLVDAEIVSARESFRALTGE
jgi:predicted membrane protein